MATETPDRTESEAGGRAASAVERLVICSAASFCSVKDCSHSKPHREMDGPFCAKAWCDYVSTVCECK